MPNDDKCCGQNDFWNTVNSGGRLPAVKAQGTRATGGFRAPVGLNAGTIKAAHAAKMKASPGGQTSYPGPRRLVK